MSEAAATRSAACPGRRGHGRRGAGRAGCPAHRAGSADPRASGCRSPSRPASRWRCPTRSSIPSRQPLRDRRRRPGGDPGPGRRGRARPFLRPPRQSAHPLGAGRPADHRQRAAGPGQAYRPAAGAGGGGADPGTERHRHRRGPRRAQGARRRWRGLRALRSGRHRTGAGAAGSARAHLAELLGRVPPLARRSWRRQRQRQCRFGAAPPPPAGGEPVPPGEPGTPETPSPWRRRSPRPVPPWASWPSSAVDSSFTPPSTIPGWSRGPS